MTKSFDASLPTDRDRIRYEIGDIDTTQMFLEDETIDAILVAFGNDVGKSVVSCARAIAAQLRRPDFRVDWMQVSDQVEAASAYDRLADQKETEWGVGGTVASTSFPTRRDTYWGNFETDTNDL
jgi:hypothetical protein